MSEAPKNASTRRPPKIQKEPASTAPSRTDIILSMSHTATEDYMDMIVKRQKNHEFRKKRYPPTVERFWFYETAPTSAITHICHVGSVVVRPAQASEGRVACLLKEDGHGNADYNAYHPHYDRSDYAYPVLSCYRLERPIGLAEMKDKYGIKGAPQGMVCGPPRMAEDVKWEEQNRIWSTL